MKNRLHINWKYQAEEVFVLNLDEEFDPFALVEDTFYLKFKKFEFKGGEPHFQITTEIDKVGHLIISQRYNSVKDLFDIVLANDAARRMGFNNISLVLPYFPAARQDRVCNVGEPLTIKVFTDIINNCNFDKVIIYSPHSEVTPALLNNVEVFDHDFDFVKEIVYDNSDGHNFNIVCPDAGAGKRVGKLVQQLSNGDGFRNYHLIRCEKIRDVKDGSLKEFYVQADDLNGYPTLIVDDINSMAGTFIGLGKKLKEKNCGRLLLFTSHSDCVQGIQNAVEYFDQVYTSNSKQNWDKYHYTLDNKFTCFKIQ